MPVSIKHGFLLATLWFAALFTAAPASAQTAGAPPGQDIAFPSGALTLHGLLFKPDGDGPFPAILWNHGSEPHPDGYVGRLSTFFVAAGYVFFSPFRSGQGGSPGPYITDQLNAVPPGQRNQLQVQLLQAQLGDQLAGLAALKAQPFVDSANITVMGGSYGGIQTLLGAAAANAGYKTAVACSAAAESWKGNPLLQKAMLDTVAGVGIPMFLLQAQNDFDLAPNQALAARFQALGKPVKAMVYPLFGSGAVGQEGHNMCFTPAGAAIWGPDALAFIANPAG
jgi:dienelactone hydrolase